MLEVLVGDITKLQTEAIVNAANRSLLGGGGVDGAIHRAAGPELLACCAGLGGCQTGEAKCTPGFKLPSKYVIHTVGPVYAGGGRGEAELLASCYRRCLEICREKGLRSVAFPCISTGVYGYPKREAAEIALATVRKFLAESRADLRVVFCCFSQADADLYRELLGD